MSTDAAMALLNSGQRRVFDLLIEGNSNRQIAERLTISEKTVKTHLTALLRLFNCDSRCRLVAKHYRGEL